MQQTTSNPEDVSDFQYAYSDRWADALVTPTITPNPKIQTLSVNPNQGTDVWGWQLSGRMTTGGRATCHGFCTTTTRRYKNFIVGGLRSQITSVFCVRHRAHIYALANTALRSTGAKKRHGATVILLHRRLACGVTRPPSHSRPPTSRISADVAADIFTASRKTARARGKTLSRHKIIG